MAMLELQADMQPQQQQQQYSYFPGHYSARDPDLSGDNINIWPPRSGNGAIVWPPSSINGNAMRNGQPCNDSILQNGQPHIDSLLRNGQPHYDSIMRNGQPNIHSVVQNGQLYNQSVVRDGQAYDGNVVKNVQQYNYFLESLSPNQHSVYQEMVRQTMLRQEAMSNSHMALQSPGRQHFVFKEMVKQTMLQQESVFKDQVHSLHCVYNRHREMLDEMRLRQLNAHQLNLELLRSNPMLSQFSSERENTCQVTALPWLTRTVSQSSVSPVQNNLIDLNYSDCEVSTDVVHPIQAKGHVNETLVLESKFKRYGKKILDLERPAEEYIDGEDGIPLAVKVEDLPKESSGGFLKSRTESSYGIMDLNLEYQEDDTFHAFPVKSDCLADLNEPAQLEDEAHPDSGMLKQPLELAADGSLHNENTVSAELKLSVDVLNADREPCIGISDLNCNFLEDNVFGDSKCGQSHELADLLEPSKYENDTYPKSNAILSSDPGQEIVDQLGKVDSNIQDDQAELSDKEGSNESCSSELDQSETEEELPSNNDGAGENSRYSNSLSGEMTSTLSENTEQVEQVRLAQMAVRRSGRLRWERLGSIPTASTHTSPKRNRCSNMTFPEIVQALPCERSHLYSGEMSKRRHRAIVGSKSGCDKIFKHRRKRRSTCVSNAITDHEFEDEHGGCRKSIKIETNPGDSQDLHSMLTANEPNDKAFPSLCINTNSHTNEDESASTPSSLSREVHLVAPQGLESMETCQVRAAVEALISMSSCTEGVTSISSEVLHAESLYFLASIAASLTDDPEADYGLSLSKDGNGLTSDEIDYFEAMTLKLPEIEGEEYHCSDVNNQMEEEEPYLVDSPIRRKGKLQKRDFQSEVLPSLVSLSRYEVTEDLQVIGSIPTAARSRNNTAKRLKNRASDSASNMIDSTSCSTEEGEWGIDWGKVTRRGRGKRCRVSLLGSSFASRYWPWMN
ncbi:hypothetical protein LINGRAHAP2_LOCUS9713 [Linum grandiflorum]